jgi:hypothetical protein
MPAIMAASDIFFLPSRNEGISQALYEAMASGLVVVGALVGGQGELVSQDCGILISPATNQNEATEYADILHQLICDSPRRKEMSQASRKRIVEKFTITQMGEIIQKNLSKIIENKKSRIKKPVTEIEKQSINREIQYLVEFLQARQALRRLNQEYSAMIQPKPPSHWFYLWLRQLFLPVSERVRTTRLGQILVGLKKWLKRTMIKGG